MTQPESSETRMANTSPTATTGLPWLQPIGNPPPTPTDAVRHRAEGAGAEQGVAVVVVVEEGDSDGNANQAASTSIRMTPVGIAERGKRRHQH